MSKKFYGRASELSQIESFINEEGASVLFIKGRRRIGKTWVLNEIAQRHKKRCVIYTGKSLSLKTESFNLLSALERHFKDEEVSRMLSGKNEVDLSVVFERLLTLLEKTKSKPILILDEVQWFGNDGGKEFSSTLKEKWSHLEQNNKIKIIITGSSARYFKDYLEKNEGFLRGITDRDHITIPPFSLGELKKFFFPNYKDEEIAFIHMVTGGVAKYIDILRKNSGRVSFINCINKAFFTKGNFFLREIEDLLTIDLNKTRTKTAIKILSVLSNNTVQASFLIEKLKDVISERTIYEILQELILLDIVGTKTFDGKIIVDLTTQDPNSKKRYYIKDSMLMFYFGVIEPKLNEIQSNEEQSILFKDILTSKTFPQVDGFTGDAFELLLFQILSDRRNKTTPIFKILGIENNYEFNTFKNKETQVDCYIVNEKDKSLKIIECKWISKFDKSSKDYSDEVKRKKLNLENYFTQYYYLYSLECPKVRKEKMEELGVTAISLSDLFDIV